MGFDDGGIDSIRLQRKIILKTKFVKKKRTFTLMKMMPICPLCQFGN